MQAHRGKGRVFVTLWDTCQPETRPETRPCCISRFNYVTDGGSVDADATTGGPLALVNWDIIKIPHSRIPDDVEYRKKVKKSREAFRGTTMIIRQGNRKELLTSLIDGIRFKVSENNDYIYTRNILPIFLN